jgi:hypothetical protein
MTALTVADRCGLVLRVRRGRQVRMSGMHGLDPAAPRARILLATVSRHGSRWYVSLNLRAPDLHASRRHLPRPADGDDGFVGVDRGLAAFAVAATAEGTEVGLFDSPMPLRRSMVRLRRLSRRASATQPRSGNRARATRGLSRQHARSPTSVDISSTRSPASSSRPTTGSVWKTSPSPTSWPTGAWPAPLATPPGPSAPMPRPRTAKQAAG